MLDAMEQAAAARRVKTLRIDGSVPVSERQALVTAFQALPEGTQAVFVLSILAAGQGLTLTAASTAVFGELRWVPGELLQVEDEDPNPDCSRSRSLSPSPGWPWP